MDNLIITPKTKIYDLLEAYPQLEDILISSAPQFKKLQNPILRKTIAKITSISQAAIIGGINVEDLVNKLRISVGQDHISDIERGDVQINKTRTKWFDEKLIANTIDVRDMLNEGEHPVHEVLSAIKKLKEKEILKVISPFIPAPLIEKSLSLGYQHWLEEISNEEYNIYFISV